MELAKNYSNWHRLQELQRALQRIEKNCNNSILIIPGAKKLKRVLRRFTVRRNWNLKRSIIL
ncbi:TPA: DUF1090 family protein [Escherichia coli]|nr:DUF1090 family protein [Escherichia coli]